MKSKALFIMAAPDWNEKEIAKALNSARNANILDYEDSEDVRGLISDYFNAGTNSQGDENDVGRDSDSSDSDKAFASDNEEHDEDQRDDSHSSDSENDDALVQSEGINPEINVQDNVDVHYDEERVKVETFDCRCKVKTVVLESSPQSSDVHKSAKLGCIRQFSCDEVLARRMDMAEFTEAEKDMILLGVLAGMPMNSGEMTRGKPYRQKKRKRQCTSYMVDSNSVCRETFKFIYGISQNKLTAVLKHYCEHGVTPRKKKSGGRKFNTKAFTPEDIHRAVRFLEGFAEDHALLLPGRVPGFKRSDVKILPSSQTKALIWRHYRDLSVARGQRAMGKSAFFKIWKEHVPFIVVGRPRSDLCWQCKANNDKIKRTSHLPEEDRIQVLQEQLHHLRNVEEERKFYKTMVEQSKDVVAAAGITDLGPNPPNTMPGRMHYSFDFAQQVHLPSSPLQPGPIYFLVPRKCGIFGVCNEALPQQINYIIDEGMSSSKGSNTVISLLHHFLEHYGLGEKGLDLHCDNCSGQNKNKYLLWYLAWRIVLGLHDSITVNFMPAGHTKFAPDWCFGLLKRRFRISEVHCLRDMCHVVESSTRRRINRAQLVGTESGQVHVKVYDWHAFFKGWCRALKGIKSLHHFRFSSEQLGVVFGKKTLTDEERAFHLIMDATGAQQRMGRMPPELPPPGLSADRQAYLRRFIRPFVRHDVQDRLCP